MLIKNISLKNYGAIRSAQLEFQAGWNLINGSNGNGKSHIIRAMAYALINKTFGKIEDDCNWDTDKFQIAMEAVYQNIDFKWGYSYARKSGINKECTIGQDTFTTVTEVNEELKKYFDPTLCSASIISFQGNMDIVTAKDAERREILKKIYDLSFTDQIKKLDEEKIKCEEDKRKLEQEIYALQNKEYDIKEVLPFPFDITRYKEIELEIKEIENKLVQYENFKTSLSQLSKEVDFLKVKKEDYQESLNRLNDTISKLSNNLKEVNDKIEDLDVDTQIQDIKDALQTLEKRESINALQCELKDIVFKRIKPFDDEVFDKKQEELHNLKYNLKSTQERLDLINKGKCPTCGHEFENAEKEKYEEDLSDLQKSISLLEDEVSSLREEKNKIDTQLKEQETLKNRRAHLESQIELEEQKVLSKIESYRRDKEDIIEKEKLYKKEVNTISEDLKDYESQKIEAEKNLASNEKELEVKIEEYEDFKKQNTILDVDNLNNSKKALRDQITQYDNLVVQNEIIEENNEKLKKQKSKDERNLTILQDKVDKEVKEISQYEEAVKVYKRDLPKYIVSYLLEDLKYGMNDLLNEAYNGRYQVEMQETNSGLKILYGNKKKDIALSSGAEQNLFNLGFKNAFSYLSGLQILFLDESLNFADDNIAKQTFNHLNLKIEKGDLEQIFVITHKPKIKELLEADYGAKVFTVDDGNVKVGDA